MHNEKNMNSETALLEIRDLHVQYDTDDAVVHALNGFSLSVNSGEKLGLVGETGAGKSTMAMSILKLLPEKVGRITRGSILFRRENLLDVHEVDMLSIRGKEISMIFQDPMTSLNPVLTVGEQILEVLRLHFPNMSKNEKEQRVDNILNLVGIPATRKNDYPHQFSGGMKQRIVIAIALISEPNLLLADEPTTALDVTIQAQILELIKQLNDRLNSAVILITHNLGVVAEFCDKVAIVYAGEVVEYGTVEEIYSRKKNHPYTEGLFKCIPDLFNSAKRLQNIPGLMPDPTDLPQGCKFAPRCQYCTQKCETENPPVYTSGNHGIKCHLFSAEEAK